MLRKLRGLCPKSDTQSVVCRSVDLFFIVLLQVKSAGAGNLKKMGKLMSKCMSPEDVDTVSLDDLGLNCSDSTAPSFSPDKATVSA